MKALAEELQVLADTTHVPGSETGATKGHTCSMSQVNSVNGVHTMVDPKVFEVVMMVRRLAQREHSAALSQLLPCLCCHEVWCECW